MRLSISVVGLLGASTALGAETMRIAVGGEVSQAVVAGESLYWALDDGQGEGDGLSFLPLDSSPVRVNWVEGRVSWQQATGEVNRGIRLRAGPEADSALTFNGLRLRGDLLLLPGKSGVLVVNVLGLEEYLVGVLGSEMPRSFPMEALKAQAVAARTYALNKKLEQYGQPFHLGSGVISQVYGGLAVEDERLRRAVQETTGLVLTWQLQPIEAYFHASCGGRTEGGLEALGRDVPWLRSVSCPCDTLPSTRWSLTLEEKELRKLGGDSVEVQSRTKTGRVRRLSLGARAMDAVTFRERVGYARLRSLDFVARTTPSGVRIEGAGFGHGAGLCQWGAQVLAERGWDFRRILRHYYASVELQTLY